MARNDADAILPEFELFNRGKASRNTAGCWPQSTERQIVRKFRGKSPSLAAV